MTDARVTRLAFALGLATVTAGQAAAAAGAPEMHSYVTIAGLRYLIATLGGRVRVTGDPTPAPRSEATRAQMRQAVVEATGCRIVEDRWSGTVLLGALDCRDRAPRKDR